MKVRSKEFKKISIRARVAYGICCLENALEYYGISGEGWNLLLEKLWAFTMLPSEAKLLNNGGVEFILERWKEVLDLLPIYFKQDNLEYSEAMNKWKYASLSREEYELLKNDYYNNSNNIIEILCEKIYDIGIEELYAGLDDISFGTLEKLQQLIDIMYSNRIPLPQIIGLQKYEYAPSNKNRYSYGWGETFDGRQYSKFLKPD